MNPDVLLLVNVWDAVKHYVPKKDRIEAAEHMLRVFDEEADLGDVTTEMDMFDSVLKTAAKSHFGMDDIDEEDDWD